MPNRIIQLCCLSLIVGALTLSGCGSDANTIHAGPALSEAEFEAKKAKQAEERAAQAKAFAEDRKDAMKKKPSER